MRTERRVERRDRSRSSRPGDRPRDPRGEDWIQEEETWVFFRERVDERAAADIRFLREALGIRPEVRELRLVFGSLRQRDDEIALLTRSIMEILLELSIGVEIPEQHIAEGRARPLPSRTAARKDAADVPRVHVQAASDPPADAFVAVRYRGYAFWIDDRDIESKRVFTFLRMFSSIAETGVAPQFPILTIPAN
jgi:hypothetical protein